MECGISEDCSTCRWVRFRVVDGKMERYCHFNKVLVWCSSYEKGADNG